MYYFRSRSSYNRSAKLQIFKCKLAKYVIIFHARANALEREGIVRFTQLSEEYVRRERNKWNANSSVREALEKQQRKIIDSRLKEGMVENGTVEYDCPEPNIV